MMIVITIILWVGNKQSVSCLHRCFRLRHLKDVLSGKTTPQSYKLCQKRAIITEATTKEE